MSLIPKITAAGKAAALAAYALNQSITITHMSLGAVAYTITGQETELQDLREVSSKIDGAQNSDGTATITGLFLASDFSSSVYVVKEVGFHIGDPNDGGVLFAVYSRPNWVCAYRGGTIEADFAPSFTLEFDDVPDGSVTITSDPSAGFDAAVMREHLSDADPHEQYVRHDASQGLTAAKQAQARANIAAEKDGDALKRDGTLAMLAPLVLSGNAGSPLHAVPLQQLQAYVTAQIDALPGDKFLAGLSGYDATTNTLSLLMSDDSTVSVDLTTLVGDAVATHEGKTVAHTPAQCGAEPSGAVAQHVEDYAHFSLSAIQALFDAQRLKQNPIGSCFLNYGSTAPEYSIEPAGQLLNRADYPSLWQHAQDNDLVISDNNWTVGGISEKTFFSSGNGSTNFRVPRLGGLFPRFADRGAGIDVSLLVGTYKADQNKEHDHTTDEQGNHWHIGTTNSDGEHTHTVSYGVYDENGGGKKVGSGDSSKFEQAGDGITINAAGSHTHTFSTSEVGLHSHTTDQSGGSEARPKSVAFLLCMWAK